MKKRRLNDKKIECIAKKENKKGQAFLIGSILIISVLITFITISNYSREVGFSSLSYEAEKINIESEKVIDYALINKNPSEAMNHTALDRFTNQTSNILGEEKRIYFISENTSGKIECYNWTSKKNKNACQIKKKNNNIIATVSKENYTFKKNQGLHFYFVVVEEKRGEKYVYTNSY